MVTVTFDPGQVITWLIIGLIAGFLAASLVRGRGMGVVGNIVVGLLGALIGGFLFRLFNIQIPALSGGVLLSFYDMFAAFIGALIILVIAALVYRRRL